MNTMGKTMQSMSMIFLMFVKTNLLTKKYSITVFRIVLHIHQPYFYTEHKLSLFTFDRYDDIIMDLVRERRCVRL